MLCSHPYGCTENALPGATLCRLHRGYVPHDRIPGSVGFDKRVAHDATCLYALGSGTAACTCIDPDTREVRRPAGAVS